MSRRIFITQVVAALASAAFTLSAWCAQPAFNTLKGNTPADGHGDVAIRGYDTVAYFTDGKPVIGSGAFVAEWMGAKWQFASREHLDLFKADPAKYAPQYGGYCAYGVAQGYLVKVEPDQWTVIDGKLYLNYDASVHATWKKDPKGYNRIADGKFVDLLKQ